MDFNRNQIFMAGVVILLFGIQLRVVDAFVLNEPASRFVEKRLNKNEPAPLASRSLPVSLSSSSAPNREVVRPPNWIGWALLSVGGVLILHSLAMPRPD